MSRATTATVTGPDRPLRIWLVTDVYPPDCGGSGWSTHSLAQALSGAGHQVEVIAPDPAGRWPTRRVFGGVRITEVGVRRARRNPLRRLGARDYAHAAIRAHLEDRLDREPEVDLVHGQHLHGGPPAAEAARSRGRAAVVTLRDYWPVCLHGTSWWGGELCPGCSPANLTGCMDEYWGWPRPLARAMVPWARRRLRARRRGLGAAHVVVTVSDAVRRRVVPELGDVELAVVPNIVEVPDAEPGRPPGREGLVPEGPFLVAAGKLTTIKGFDRLLEALHAAGCSWPLVLAGRGPERHRLERRARELDLPVRFAGWVPHDALLGLVRRARALVLPSVWEEPLSRLLLEAMSLQTPVIAWATGGTPEVIEDGTDGWLVREPTDLARALAALQDETRRAEVAEAARRTARQRFAPAAVLPLLESVYRRALRAAGRAT